MLDRPPSENVAIRPARLADAAAILALHQASIRELASGAYSPAQIDSWSEKPDGVEPYEVSIRDDTRHVVVAEWEDDLAGWGRLDLNDGEVSAVYTHPDFAREGVGSAILAHLEEVAREKGMDRVHLWASLNAVPFYESAGFEAMGETLHETTGGVVIECVEMEKGLG